MDYSSLYSTDYTSVASNADSVATLGATAMLSSLIATYGIIMLAVYVLIIIAQWKIFEKAGEKGWKSLIPIYNVVILFKISGLSPWLVLIYLTTVIPVVGYIAALVMSIILMVKLGQAFNKSSGFIVGLILLTPIFEMILAFGSSEYVGNGTVVSTAAEVPNDDSNKPNNNVEQ